ncbi:MAG TPA: class I SAM-dependent methyltransferase [Alphaproteobacteria bacterium]|nr:class I SAM-dependent methyltransferase [Alphaproteobacteria bacterium]
MTINMKAMDETWKSQFDSRAKREDMPDYKKSCWTKEGFEELLHLTMKFVDNIKEADPTLETILDVGCGPGIYAKALHDKGYKITGIDYSEETINLAKSKYPKIHFEIGSGYDLKFKDKSFDLIISIGALQCLVDYEKFLNEISRVAGKYLIISTLWREDDGRNPTEILKKQLMEDSWPTRCYNPSEILPILEKHGFESFAVIRDNPETGKEIKDGYFIIAER